MRASRAVGRRPRDVVLCSVAVVVALESCAFVGSLGSGFLGPLAPQPLQATPRPRPVRPVRPVRLRAERRTPPPRPSAPQARPYKALTKINVRVSPEIKSLRSGQAIAQGETFLVTDIIDSDGQSFLRLASGDGWVFSKGVAGSWLGRTIAEPVTIVNPAAKAQDTSNELVKNLKKLVKQPLQEIGRDPLWYGYLTVIIGILSLIFVMFNGI